MKQLSSSIFMAPLLFAFHANADTLKIDASHTNLGFKIKHLVISTVNGRFNKFEGTGEYDPKSGKIENLKVKIDVSSIDTNEPKRDTHLKSKDFFDVEKYPEIEFTETNAVYKKNKVVKINGSLTIHGITKPVSLELDLQGPVVDPWETKRLVFNLNGEINRKDFGLTWNKALDSGGVMIADSVKLVIEGEAIVSK